MLGQQIVTQASSSFTCSFIQKSFLKDMVLRFKQFESHFHHCHLKHPFSQLQQQGQCPLELPLRQTEQRGTLLRSHPGWRSRCRSRTGNRVSAVTRTGSAPADLSRSHRCWTRALRVGERTTTIKVQLWLSKGIEKSVHEHQLCTGQGVTFRLFPFCKTPRRKSPQQMQCNRTTQIGNLKPNKQLGSKQ